MAEISGQAEPRAAGRRRMDLEGSPDAPGTTPPGDPPRFSLDGEDIVRYIPDPSAETLKKAQEAALEKNTLPHVVLKERVAVIASLKAQGYTRKDIAAVMQMTPRGVDWCVREARKRNILPAGMVEAARELDEEGLPLAVENIIDALRRGDVEVAMRLAEGRGLLRSYTNNKNDGPPPAPRRWRFNSISCCRTARRRRSPRRCRGRSWGLSKA
jgi:hypothetical protein